MNRCELDKVRLMESKSGGKSHSQAPCPYGHVRGPPMNGAQRQRAAANTTSLTGSITGCAFGMDVMRVGDWTGWSGIGAATTKGKTLTESVPFKIRAQEGSNPRALGATYRRFTSKRASFF